MDLNENKLRDLLVEDMLPVTFEDVTYNKHIILEMDNNQVSTYYNSEGTLITECKYPTLEALTRDWIRSRDSYSVFKRTFYTDINLLRKIREHFPFVKNIYLKDFE